MATQDFSARLRLCMRRGSLTISDLARWFGRPIPTVRTWVLNGRTPCEGYYEESNRRLKILEKEIERRRGSSRIYRPLVPVEITKRERPLYLCRYFDAINDRRVSARHPTD
jgi:hypothetical protein